MKQEFELSASTKPQLIFTKEQLLDLERFAERSADNLIQAITRSKQPPLERLLFALGIRHVGEYVAKILSRKFGSVGANEAASQEELTAIEGIGPTIADSFSIGTQCASAASSGFLPRRRRN